MNINGTTSTLIRYALPHGYDRPVYAQDFRKMVADAGDGILDESVFHYSNGKPAQGTPMTTFVGGHGWVGILLHNEVPPDFLIKLSGIGLGVMTDITKKPIVMSIQYHDQNITPVAYPIEYALREVVIRRRSDRRRNMPLNELVKEVLEKEIRASLPDYMQHLEIDINILNADQKGLRIRSREGDTGEFSTLANAIFTCNMKISGMWQVGALKGRGYGRIIRRFNKMKIQSQMESTMENAA